MSEIKPKYVDDEPVCDDKCFYFERITKITAMCNKVEFSVNCYPLKSPCIPALRQQRDKYKAELEEERKYTRNLLDQRDKVIAERDELRTKYILLLTASVHTVCLGGEYHLVWGLRDTLRELGVPDIGPYPLYDEDAMEVTKNIIDKMDI